MRQLTFIKPNVLEWHEVPEPVLKGADDALVRPLVVARCDLDLPILQGQVPFPGPFPFGHESVCEVIAIADGVKSVRIGQKVIVPFQISCGGCGHCQRGISNSCDSVPRLSHYGLGRDSREWGGALSDLLYVPFADAMLVPIPDGIDVMALASASDNLPDAWRTVGPQLASKPSASVLIVGGLASSIGVYAAAMAVALGASQVDYLDTDLERLQLAEAAGAHVIQGSPPIKAGSYSITVDASGDPKGLACALRSIEPGGICTTSAIYYQDVSLPLLHMYSTGVQLNVSRVSAREAIPHVLKLIQNGRFHPEQFTTLTASWEDAPQALLTPTTKLVITRD